MTLKEKVLLLVAKLSVTDYVLLEMWYCALRGAFQISWIGFVLVAFPMMP